MSTHPVGFDLPESNSKDWRAALRQSWHDYIVHTLGRPPSVADERSEIEISGANASQYCDNLASAGILLKGKSVLEVGCGHGTLAVEMARRGAFVTAIEPCESWRKIGCAHAVEQGLGNQVKFSDGNAEELAFPNGSFDLVVSLQVLEHVEHPKRAISEMARVLREDGVIHVSCENYLAFHEQHYDLPWLPLLPKRLAAMYLRHKGRNPSFLLRHVTYTTYPQLVWWCLCSGLWSRQWQLGRLKRNRMIQLVDILKQDRRRLFAIGFDHFLVAQRNLSTKRFRR